jgi:hypothetical protein
MPLEKAEAAVKFEKIEITSDGTIAGTKILINGSEIPNLSSLSFRFYDDDTTPNVYIDFSTADPNPLPGSVVQTSNFSLIAPVAVALPGSTVSGNEVWGPASLKQVAAASPAHMPRGTRLRDLMKLL